MLGETLAAMSDDHRSSNGNPNENVKDENGSTNRKSSSLKTKQNAATNTIATSGAFSKSNKIV